MPQPNSPSKPNYFKRSTSIWNDLAFPSTSKRNPLSYYEEQQSAVEAGGACSSQEPAEPIASTPPAMNGSDS